MIRFFSFKRFFLTIGIASILSGFLVFFPARDTLAESTAEAAKREGKLTLYFGMAIPDIQTIANAFTKRYPFIRVDYYRAGGDKLLQKILAEKAAGKFSADVVQMVGSLIGAYKEEGLLTKYVSPESRHYPPGIKDPEGYWTGFYSTYKLFVYNTRMLSNKQIPRTYDDILDPKWKGKIGISRNEFEWYVGMLDYLGKEKGKQFMQRFGEQELRVHAGLPQVTQLLAAGEFPIALSNQAWALDVIKAGAPVAVITSISPIIDAQRGVGIAVNPPHPNAAKLMVDFLLSREGQEVLDGIGRTAIRPDVKRDPAIEELNLTLFPFAPKPPKEMERFIREYRMNLLKISK